MGAIDDCLNTGGSAGNIDETPTDNCPQYDSDCDEISNAVETNDANEYLGLNSNLIDINPSIANGWPCSTYCTGIECGWVTNALNMVNTGPGYYHYRNNDPNDTDDWGVLATINMIEGAGRARYINNYTSARIGVGDLSWGDQYGQSFGGYWGPHVCHQNGLEVDIRYVRNDGSEGALNIADYPELFDEDKTIRLIEHLISYGNIYKIYVDTVHSILNYMGYSFIVHKPGHSDHIHVRIVDPDGTGN